jgi:hypothetical protein
MRNEAGNVLAKKFRGKTSYTETISDAHPTYLHEMWCQATRNIGNTATLHEISIRMNLQSEALHDRPTLQLDKLNCRGGLIRTRDRNKEKLAFLCDWNNTKKRGLPMLKPFWKEWKKK